MKALLRAEMLKTTTARTPAGMLLATLALAGFTVVVSVPKEGDQNAPMSLDDPDLLAAVVGNSLGAPAVLVVLLGVIAFTQEFRYGTATSTYLGEPRRTRILVAKWLSLLLASVVITVAALVLTVPFSILLIQSRNGEAAVAGQFWQTVAAGFAFMAAFGVMGVALGALVRHQIAAVIGVLVWLLFIEQIATTSFPAVGRWMPWGAAYSLLQLAPSVGLEGRLLSPAMGGLLLMGYTAAAVALALLLTPRRDVL